MSLLRQSDATTVRDLEDIRRRLLRRAEETIGNTRVSYLDQAASIEWALARIARRLARQAEQG